LSFTAKQWYTTYYATNIKKLQNNYKYLTLFWKVLYITGMQHNVCKYLGLIYNNEIDQYFLLTIVVHVKMCKLFEKLVTLPTFNFMQKVQ